MKSMRDIVYKGSGLYLSLAVCLLSLAMALPANARTFKRARNSTPAVSRLKVKPGKVNFGKLNLAKQSAKTKYLYVYNNGTADLNVDFGDVGAPFAIACSCSHVTIPPHGTIRAVMAFQPTTDGVFSETFEIKTDAGKGPANMVLTLKGKAVGTPPGSGTAVSGVVSENQNTIANATVNLYVAADDQTGQGSGLLSSTSTNSEGRFAFAQVHCPDPGAQVYATAAGGTPQGCSSQNKTIGFMAALGSCADLQGAPPVAIDEVSTAAAASSLAPFTASDDPTQVGSSGTDRNQLANAFAAAAYRAGTASNHSLSAELAACAQCGGAQNPACTRVLECSSPGAIAMGDACIGGSAPIRDTLGATLSVSGNAPSGSNSWIDGGSE
jgi:hypothetical protein